jgi:hypothetical protein
MATVESLITMQVLCSFANCGLNENPSLVKNSVVAVRSYTGRVTNAILDIVCPFARSTGCSAVTAPSVETHRCGAAPTVVT